MKWFSHYTAFINRFIPDKNKTDLDLYYQSFLLVSAYLVSTIFLLAFIFMHYLAGNYLEVYILSVNAILFPLMFTFYPRSGNNVFFGNAIVGAGFLGFLVIAYVDGGIYAPVIPWFTAVSITGFLFANKQSGVFWTTLALITIVTYYVLEQMGVHFPSYFPPENRLTKLGTSYLGSSVYIIITVFSYDYLNNKKNKRLNELLISNAEKQEELQRQQEEIKQQRDMVSLQRDKLQEIYNLLNKSIDYAKKIQQAILSNVNLLEDYFVDYFVFFKPKDKVSGDFYWWAKVDNQIVLTVADCTGHGVPGAFMSLLGISYLREIVQKGRQTDTGTILRELRTEIIKSLNQTGEKGTQKDGMDMAIVAINKTERTLQFSGANNSLYLIKTKRLPVLNDKIIEFLPGKTEQQTNEIKPDKMPIAIYDKMNDFSTHDLPFESGDSLYLFSDGFADQFGGENDKKFKTKALKKLLLQTANLSKAEQKKYLENALMQWQSTKEQVDDITIVGIKL